MCHSRCVRVCVLQWDQLWPSSSLCPVSQLCSCCACARVSASVFSAATVSNQSIARRGTETNPPLSDRVMGYSISSRLLRRGHAVTWIACQFRSVCHSSDCFQMLNESKHTWNPPSQRAGGECFLTAYQVRGQGGSIALDYKKERRDIQGQIP